MIRLFLIAMFMANSLLATNIQTIEYSHAGNFKGLFSLPLPLEDESTTNENLDPIKYPIVIFSYDQYVDFLGKTNAARIGYDLEAFIKEFNDWGYAAFVPIERHRKLNALKGALFHLQRNKQIDTSNIFLVGSGEGALLSLLAVHNAPKVKGIVIIDPDPIHKKGHLSFPNLVRQMDSIKSPILFIAGKSNKRWKNKRSNLLHKLFIDNQKSIKYKEYFFKKKWFWNPKYRFMDDIKDFIDEESQ
ncbi:hypothetical protein DID80_05140 [Candidatus Marinamargulisbacteria bacterium SCGC AAA071-K20]|nr:hypothetical protein DID80_05140 [Candidatus Marinamargulisbacteria bacterium SCGC AAA071-K20]